MTDERQQRFAAFFQEHRRPLAAYIAKVYPWVDPDDVVASTFSVAWSRFDDIPADYPRPWLIGVSRNVVRNLNRADRRRRSFLDGVAFARPKAVAELHDHTLLTEQTEQLTAAMQQLSSEDREVLVLAAWAEMGPQELAVALGVTANAATQRLHRARRRLRDAYHQTSIDTQEAAG